MEPNPYAAIRTEQRSQPPPRRRIAVARAKTFWQSLSVACAKKTPAVAESAFFFGGLGAVAFGCWMAWHPLGPIVGGGIAFWLSLLISADRGDGKRT